LTSETIVLHFTKTSNKKGHKMAVPKNKKRYMITLTPAVVVRFQALAKNLGMPPSVMSGACEDALRTISDVFQTAKDKGSIEISDLYRLMGNQMELLESERKKDNDKIGEVIQESKKIVKSGNRANTTSVKKR
jgi:hypothetical protein